MANKSHYRTVLYHRPVWGFDTVYIVHRSIPDRGFIDSVVGMTDNLLSEVDYKSTDLSKHRKWVANRISMDPGL